MATLPIGQTDQTGPTGIIPPYIQAFNPFYNSWSSFSSLGRCNIFGNETICSGRTRIFVTKTFILILIAYCITNIILTLFTFDKLKQDSPRDEFRTTWCVIFSIMLAAVFIIYFILHRLGEFNQFGTPPFITGLSNCKNFCIGKQCTLFNPSLFGTLCFLAFGVMLIAYGIQFNKNLNDTKENSSWIIFSDTSIGMGTIYILIAIGLIFTMIKTPCGSNWGTQIGISIKVVFFMNIIIALFLLFCGLGVPILVNMNKLTT